MNPITKRLHADFDRVMQDQPKSAGTLQDQGFRFICIDGECDWKHPAEIPANAVDCTDMDDDEFADYLFAQLDAEEGILAERAFYADVHPDDIPPPTTVQLFSGMPRDPYGCANPVSQTEEE